jgi:hypothetical protein
MGLFESGFPQSRQANPESLLSLTSEGLGSYSDSFGSYPVCVVCSACTDTLKLLGA